MNNISDFFRDPRLDNFDDPQEGVAQLDDLMDPVQAKVPNKMVRYFYLAITASTTTTTVTTVRVPDNVNTFLKMKPEYWIIRLHSDNADQASATGPVTLRRQGGDDVKVLVRQAIESRIILPGPSDWLDVVVPGFGLNPPIIICTIAACTGYNPLEVL